MEFLDRINEQKELNRIFKTPHSNLVIVYGRRRAGKSELLKYVTAKAGIYYLSDLNEKKIQIQQLAETIAIQIPDFDNVIYPSWYAILLSLNNRLTKKMILVLDEFPYLAATSPEIPSEIQKLIDLKKLPNIDLILCGSSQQMMRELTLGTTAPLYGRANSIMKVYPLKIAWLQKYLTCSAEQAVMEFATWGGIPRYWEVRANYKTLEQAQLGAIMNKGGLLYEEPMRLFMDDLRTSVQAYTIVNLVGNGHHRISELATALEKPATNFARPLEQLISMDYLRKEIPFGENEAKSKKSLYWIADNFMNFYMQMVATNKSLIELGIEAELKKKLNTKLPQLYAQVYEELVRASVNDFNYFGKKWAKAYRYWGKPDNKTEIEVDIIVKSLDEKSILIGEVKWSNTVDLFHVEKQLDFKIALLNLPKHIKVYKAIWVKNKSKFKKVSPIIFDCNEVVSYSL
jgi:uncharacterized protein